MTFLWIPGVKGLIIKTVGLSCRNHLIDLLAFSSQCLLFYLRKRPAGILKKKSQYDGNRIRVRTKRDSAKKPLMTLALEDSVG